VIHNGIFADPHRLSDESLNRNAYRASCAACRHGLRRNTNYIPKNKTIRKKLCINCGTQQKEYCSCRRARPYRLPAWSRSLKTAAAAPCLPTYMVANPRASGRAFRFRTECF